MGCSTSTFFQKDNYNTYSWCGNEKDPKQIDHIFIRKEDKKRLINCETGDPAGIMSDHYAIDSKLKLAEHIPKKNHRKKKNGIHHQDVTKKKTKKKKKIEWYKILEYPDAFQTLLSKNIIISKSKINSSNNNNKDDNIDTNIDID